MNVILALYCVKNEIQSLNLSKKELDDIYDWTVQLKDSILVFICVCVFEPIKKRMESSEVRGKQVQAELDFGFDELKLKYDLVNSDKIRLVYEIQL